MYSKDVGDFDVRINHEQSTWNSSYGRTKTFERGFQTELFDTKRQVGYITHKLKTEDEDAIEEQRQEIITFRLPLESFTTEETYETTITTETKQNNRQIEEIYETTITKDTKQPEEIASQTNTQRRSNSPEELVEESYEVVSTLTKPRNGDFLITSTNPRSTIVQTHPHLSTTKVQSSEDDSSYCEEWTVTEAKRKQDGQTIKTIIDR